MDTIRHTTIRPPDVAQPGRRHQGGDRDQTRGTTSAAAAAQSATCRPPLGRQRHLALRPVDAVIALSWLPFAAIGWLLRADAHGIAWFVSLTLLISFAHQPITLALVYGDKRVFDVRRRVFTWSPVVLVAAVAAVQHVSLTVLAIVAGLWNLEHTLMQRYGILRIHGRKAGEEDGRLEKVVLIAWLVFALVWVAVDRRTPRHLERAGIGGKNRRGVELLADLRPVALWIVPVVAAVAAVATVLWLQRERRRGAGASSAKRLYMTSTAVLFATIFVDPVAGLLGFVGAHAVEYFLVVHQGVRSKYVSAEADGGAPIGHVVRRMGSTAALVLFAGVVVAFFELLDHMIGAVTYTTAILTLGGMHVLYDSFIWKRPSARGTGMLAPQSRSPARN